MKTSRRGILAVSININKLVNKATTNFLLKVSYILFMTFGIQLAYADKLTFQFLYGDATIESVYFDTSKLEYEDYATDIDKYSSFSVDSNVSPTENKVTVQLDITHNGSPDIAKVFNVISGYLPTGDDSRVMELNGSESYAVALDFWAMAPLYIKGRFIGNVTLAHNNHSNSIGANNWWITVDSGTRYSLGSFLALNVKDDMGTPYCLKQNGTNYQVIVTSGECVSTYTGITPIVNDNESASWQYVGNINFARAYGDHYSMAADDDGHPVIAYADTNGGHATVLEFNGYYSGRRSSGWRTLDTTTPNYQQPYPYISDSTGYFPSIKIYNGAPTVAYHYVGNHSVDGTSREYKPVAVKIFNQQLGWSYLGNKFYISNNEPDSGEITLGNDPRTNNLYVAFTVGTSPCFDLYIIRYDGVNNWSLYGSTITGSVLCTLSAPYFSSMGLSLDFSNGIPQVSYNKLKSHNRSRNPAEVASYNSSKGNWDIFKATSDDTSYVNTAADSLGNSYVVYQNPAKQQIIMTKFAASIPGLHMDVAAISENSNTGAYNNLVIDRYSDSPFYNQPILAFVDSSNQNRVTVLRFDGSVWHYIGKPGLPYVANSQYANPKIVISHHSIFVAFQDQKGYISVMEYPKN